MKAITYYKYGSSQNMKLEELKIPSPKTDEVLIKIYATSVNAWDLDLLLGQPIFSRLWGLFTPKMNILGSDVAGLVESVGTGVKDLKPGDRVFGDLVDNNWGGFAEYTCAKESALTKIPEGLSFVEAASIPQAACMAFQAFESIQLPISSQTRVLVNGAGGGCGTFAVQFAKQMGAQVTGVDSSDKLDYMKSIGADHVIDYTKMNYTDMNQKYDIVIDMVMHNSIYKIEKILNPGGAFRMVGGKPSKIIQTFLVSKRLSAKSGKELGVLAAKANYKLSEVVEFIQKENIQPSIDTVYDLIDVPKAMHHIGQGKTKGKLIIKVRDV